MSSKIETLYPLNINSPIPFSQGPYNLYSISCLYESDDYKYLQFSHSVVSNSLQPVDCSSPGLPVHHQLPEFIQTHVHWVSNVIQPSHPLSPLLLPPYLFSNESASGSFQMSQLFASGGQSIGVSASTSVLPVNIQNWFPLGWTGWTSLLSKGFSRVFSNITAQKHQFFGTQLSL